MGKTCKYCGQEVEEGALYCSECGKELKPKVMFCPNCGVRIEPKKWMEVAGYKSTA